MLWMLFLVVGPYQKRWIDVLSRVRSITTDLGTERKLAHMVDLAPEFWKWLGVDRVTIDRRVWLFPNAVQAPGWSHVWDGLIRLGLNSLTWWPSFIESLKGLLTLLREHTTDMCDELRSSGLEAVAQLLEGLQLPYFAAWRWGTICDVCKAIQSPIGKQCSYGGAGHDRSQNNEFPERVVYSSSCLYGM